MTSNPRSGKAKLNHILGIVVAVVVGLGAAWWYFHGGKKQADQVLDKAGDAANQAKGAAQQNVQDQNAAFDASRQRQTDKRAPTGR